MGEMDEVPETMADIKRTMEQECEKLRINLEQLMNERASLTEEFRHLNELQHRLLIQLKSDTLAGEGQLHTFQVEKKRVEDRLDQLEQQLELKNKAILELDAKASEYLLKVTTASNTLYDDEDNCEENKEDRDLIKQLVYDDMLEHNDFTDEPDDEGSESQEPSEGSANISDRDSRPSTPSGSDPDSKLKSLSHESETSEMCDDTSYSLDKSNILDHSHAEEIPFDSSPPPPPMNEHTSSAQHQIDSISNLLDELKGVKEEMGRFITLKDSSMIEIEQELQETKSELSLLKNSMNNLVKGLNPEEERASTIKRDNSVKSSLPDISELQEIKEMCTVIQEEKKDLLDHMGSLKETMNEMRRDQSLSLDRRSQSHSGELNLSTLTNAPDARRSSSTCSISGKVALLEKELSDAMGKLNESALHMRLLVKEREHKQRECELLQRKVTKVEAKMHELQVTFDTLMSAIMAERDGLVKELKEKEEELSTAKKETEKKNESQAVLTQALSQVDALKAELETKNQEILKIQSLEDKNILLSQEIDNFRKLQEEWHEKEAQIKASLSEKEAVVIGLQEKIYNFEIERADFASALKGEMERLKEEASKAKEDKQNMESIFNSLQSEQEELQDKHAKLLDRFNSLTKDNNKKTTTIDSLKKETENMEKELTELRSKDETSFTEMQSKDSELQEELTAREATIQELRITITNNQKQSRENYQMLQDDMAVLQLRLSKEREEYDAVVAHLKDKCTKLEEDCQQMQQDRDSLKNMLEETKAKLSENIKNEDKLLSLNNVNNDNEDNETVEHGDNEKSSGALFDEEEFRKQISEKELQVEELETRVENLETTLLEKSNLIINLEEKLVTSDMKAEEAALNLTEAEGRMTAQLEELEKLKKNLDELKTELEASSKERTSLEDSFSQLEKSKINLEEEKTSLQQEYESKLSQLQEALDNLENDTEVKKKLG